MAITKVSSGVISANAVTATIVAENVITSSEIATDGVGTLQIADDAVTSAKLDTNIDIAGTLDVTGVLTADSNVVIAGNLTVNGSTVTNSSTNTTIEDALIELGTGTTGTPANDAGIIIERGDSNNAFMGFDESADKFIVATTTATGSSTGDLTLTAAPLVTGALTASGLSYPTSDGSANQVIKTDGSGNLSFVTAITDGAVVHNYTATGDGSTVTFDTGINPQDEVNTWVHIDGVYQNKSEYSYNGSEITFTTAPDSGAAIDIITGNQNGFSTADSVLGVYSVTTTDTDTYDTGLSATNENNVNIFIEGVYQPKSTYTWSGSTITFDANTPTGLALEVIASKTLTSGAVVTASITDDAVTTAKIADNAITSAKIVNNSITGADISATTNIVANTFTGALTGDVTGNVTGNVTGTIQTAAQPNITSVGTLSALTGGTGDLNWDSGTLFVDSSANAVGIGTDSPAHTLTVEADKDTWISRIYNTGSDANAQALLVRSDATAAHDATVMGVYTDGGYKMVVRSTGRVGIGTTAPAQKLEVKTGSEGYVARFKGATSAVDIFAGNTGSFTGGLITTPTNIPLGFSTNTGTGSLIIDTSGNVLVGKTATGGNTAGMQIIAGSFFSHVRDGGVVQILNRKTDDGDILQFEKDNSTVGSIGTQGSSTYIAGASTGLRFAGANIMPSNSAGAFTDNISDLGGNTERFKDLYLSNELNITANNTALAASVQNANAAGYGLRVTTYATGAQYGLAVDSYGGGYSRDFTVGADGNVNVLTGNLVIGTAGKGIDFSATANSSGSMSNELLDDYEEGTWTPVYKDSSGNAITNLVNQQGSYTKVGSLVYIQGCLRTQSSSSTSGVSGNLRITGLPFTSANVLSTGHVVFHTHETSSSYNAPSELPRASSVGANTTNINLYKYSGSGGRTTLFQVSDLTMSGNSNFIFFAGTYRTD